jgi:hypothetical protein
VFGRPCGVINLRHVRRTPDGTLDSLKEFIAYQWETARRYLAHLSRKEGQPRIQLVIIVDVSGAGMSNMVRDPLHNLG